MNLKQNKSGNSIFLVYRNSTKVERTSINDFHKVSFIPKSKLSLPLNKDTWFYGFYSRVHAMEYAKSSALKYIDLLIADGANSLETLKAYREKNYEDLNFNLIDANIRKVEKEINAEELALQIDSY